MFNLGIPDRILNKIIDLADFEKDGNISYAEFARIVTADDILGLKNTLVADPGANQETPGTVHVAGLQKRYQREGAAKLRPGVTAADVRAAQEQLKAKVQDRFAKLSDAYKAANIDTKGQLDRAEVGHVDIHRIL